MCYEMNNTSTNSCTNSNRTQGRNRIEIVHSKALQFYKKNSDINNNTPNKNTGTT